MHNRERISDIVDSMLDYFEVDSFSELDSLMQLELITEIEDCLDINIPIEVCGSDLQRKAFIDAVLEVYESV